MNELLATLDNCLIYKVNSKKAKTYYLCVPTMEVDNYQMYLGFPDEDLSKLPKDNLVDKIKEVIDVIQTIDNNSVYVLPDISISILEESTMENDNPYYNKILKEKIQPITAEIYETLVIANHGKKKIAQTINVIKRTDIDKKIAGWLSMRLGENNIREINFDELCNKKDVIEDVSIDYSLTLPEYQENKDSNSNNGPVKKLSPTKDNNISLGFGNTKFIIIALIFSLTVGIIVANILIK